MSNEVDAKQPRSSSNEARSMMEALVEKLVGRMDEFVAQAEADRKEAKADRQEAKADREEFRNFMKLGRYTKQEGDGELRPQAEFLPSASSASSAASGSSVLSKSSSAVSSSSVTSVLFNPLRLVAAEEVDYYEFDFAHVFGPSPPAPAVLNAVLKDLQEASKKKKMKKKEEHKDDEEEKKMSENFLVTSVIDWVNGLFRSNPYFLEDTQKTGGEHNSSRYFTLEGKEPDICVLPACLTGLPDDIAEQFFRFAWNFVMFNEGKLEIAAKDYKQLEGYMLRALIKWPERQFIIGALFDVWHVVFMRAVRDAESGEIRVEASVKLPLENLSILFSLSPEQLGYIVRSPLNGYTIQLFFAKSVNYVVKVEKNRDRFACKIFSDMASARNEYTVLQALNEQCIVYDRRDLVLEGIQLLGDIAIIMPILFKAEMDAGRTTVWLQAWDSLTVLHHAGYVHGDVRLPNMMQHDFNGSSSCRIIDFGFSVRRGHPRNSTVRIFPTSSLAALKNHHVESYPIDDAVSLLKCRYMIGKPDVEALSYGAFWKKTYEEDASDFIKGLKSLDEYADRANLSDDYLSTVVINCMKIYLNE